MLTNTRKGYLYLLIHPDKPRFVKIGRTTRSPQQRIAEHNKRGLYGEIAKATGKSWVLVHYIPVTDASKAEAYFYDYCGGKGAGAYVYEFFRGKGAGKVELLPMGVEHAMQALLAGPFLDRERYRAMLNDELREYVVSPDTGGSKC